MTAPARAVAWKVLCAIELEGSFSDDALHSGPVDKLSARDRALVTEIVYGSLRRRLTLDYFLSKVVARGWPRVDPELRVLLRLATYQIWRMDRLPDHAVVHDAVEMAKSAGGRRSAGFVNGVLRSLTRLRPWEVEGWDDTCPPWIRVSLPRWLWTRWVDRFGEETAFTYSGSLNEIPPVAVRSRAAGTAALSRATRSDLVPGAWILDPEAVRTENDRRLWRVQDEASQLIPFLLGVEHGYRVWDTCAAPGGKSAVLRELAGTGGVVVSSEKDPHRARRMAAAEPQGAQAAGHIVVADAAAAPFRAPFDAVLADVPCSGLGTLRRNPEIRWKFRVDRLAELAAAQGRILVSAAHHVRRGGLLLYSTCSTEPEENEQVVEGFLASHPGFRIRRPESPPGINTLLDARGFLRTFPSERLWDGFFAALMVRES